MADEDDSSNTTLIVVGILVAVIVANGVWGAIFFLGGGAGGGGDEKAEKQKVERGPLITIDPFVVNLSDAGKPRYLRVGISLEVGSKKEKKDINKNKGLIRVKNRYINHLSSLTTDQLRSKEDKERLSKNLKKLAKKALPEKRILGIYFTEFMIQ